MTDHVRAVDGDLPADELGPTYVHEHLIIDSSLVAERWPDIYLPSVEEAEAEMTTCVAAGVRTMVDTMPTASGRNPTKLAEVSRRTGIRVVASTGLHTDKYYEEVEWTRTEAPEQLAVRFVADIVDGMEPAEGEDRREATPLRAGVIKAGSLSEELSPRDRRLFTAAALASQETGAPILTHTEGGRGGLTQIDHLVRSGAAPERIALSHTDKVADRAYHRTMLSAGVNLCYDQALRWQGDNQTARLVAAMVEEGYGSQILLGTDGARRSLWSTLGGSPGLAWLYTGFVDLLLELGLTAQHIDALFVANPARYLAMSTD